MSCSTSCIFQAGILSSSKITKFKRGQGDEPDHERVSGGFSFIPGYPTDFMLLERLPADLPTLCRGSEVGMLSAIQNAAIADGVSHARKCGDVLRRIGVDDDQICALADCDGSHFSLHSEALCRRGGEHSENIAHAQAGLLQSFELAFGAVVAHVADIGSEK